MDTDTIATPWGMLIGGLAALAYGIVQWRGTPWIGAPLTLRERRASARALIAVGAIWLYLFWTATWPFANHLKPYLVVILATALWPLATAGFMVWFLYFAVVRLFTGGTSRG